MAKGYHPIRRRSSAPSFESSYSERNCNSYSELPSSGTSMNALRSGLTLPINNMAIPIYTSSPSREDVEMGGRVLFPHFIEEEFTEQGYPDAFSVLQEIPPPEEFGDAGPDAMHADANANSRAESPMPYISTPDGFKNSKFVEIGANLSHLAEEFKKSHERNRIRDMADEVDLGQITSRAFQNMLTELFRNGIDKYRIVSLFYFCSDILIRCIKAELMHLGSKLFFWAMQFILNNVCKWVYDHGGWERVLVKGFNVAYNLALLSALGVVICCGYVYLKNNWSGRV